MSEEENIRDVFIRRFFEPTFIDLRPYDYSFQDEEKIDWWLTRFSEYRSRLIEEIEGLEKEFGKGTLPKKDGKTYATNDFKKGYKSAIEKIIALLKK